MNYLKSRTIWAIALIFITAGVNSITEFLSPTALQTIQGILGIAGIYFRINAKQSF